jgi:hypothetical protein
MTLLGDDLLHVPGGGVPDGTPLPDPLTNHRAGKRRAGREERLDARLRDEFRPRLDLLHRDVLTGEDQEREIVLGEHLVGADPLGQEVLVVGVEVLRADHDEDVDVLAVLVEDALDGVDHVRSALLIDVAARSPETRVARSGGDNHVVAVVG